MTKLKWPGLAEAGALATSAEEGDMEDECVLDAVALKRLRDLEPEGGRGFLQNFLAEFAVEAEKDLSEIMNSALAGDEVRTRKAAHRFKSSCNIVGFLTARDLCSEIEFSDVQIHQKLAQDLRREYERCHRKLKQIFSAEGFK